MTLTNRSNTLIESPVFLVGSERSGSTLLRLMLDHHPKVAWCSEFEYAVERVGDQGWPDVRAYVDYLTTHRIFRAHGFLMDATLDYPELVNSFLKQKRNPAGKPVIGATVHKHFDQLLRIWPEARFIHLVRDPRDVARSVIGMGWAGNVWCAAETWLTAEMLWLKLRELLPEDRWIEVRYEQFIQNPREQLQRICRLLGVGFDPAMLDYADKTTYERPDPSLIERWRQQLSPREIQLVESRAGDQITQSGYAFSDLPRIKVGFWRRLRLRLHNRLAKVRFRIGRYGIKLYLADFCARRLRLTTWRERARIHINEIDTAHLR